mgnify:CR=1 FL=1
MTDFRTVRVPEGAALPEPGDVAALDADPLRCFDAATSAEMVAEVDRAHDDGDTLAVMAIQKATTMRLCARTQRVREGIAPPFPLCASLPIGNVPRGSLGSP